MKTESKTYPKIERSKKEKTIFFPENIKKVQKEEEEGKLEEFYEYELIKIPDKGQQIEDYELFKQQNYAELRKQAYGSWEKQFEMMQEQGLDFWRKYCQRVKDEYPKLEVRNA